MSGLSYTSSQETNLLRVVPDLIRGRQLLLDLIWKDVRVRYRYALMGFLWAVIEPLIMMAVLTFVFAYVFQMRFSGLVEGGGSRVTAVNILAGLIAWQFFSNSLSAATGSLIESRSLITKVRFPREIIPLASIGVSVVNFLIGGVLLLVIYTVLLWRLPGIGVIWLPVIFAVEFAMVCGLGLLFAALNAPFRDVAYMVNAALLFGFYASPIFYEPQLVADAFPRLYPVYFVNPMVGLITAYREALFLNQAPDPMVLAWPVAFAAMALGGGLYVFRKSAATLADQL